MICVPDAVQHEVMRRRAGTQTATWAPAQQRTANALRCVRGTREENSR
jgi:hypothetical protein